MVTERRPPADRGLADALVHSRLAAGLRQEDLAALVGCSQPYLSLLERGKRRPSDDLLSRIAAAVDCDLVPPQRAAP